MRPWLENDHLDNIPLATLDAYPNLFYIHLITPKDEVFCFVFSAKEFRF